MAADGGGGGGTPTDGTGIYYNFHDSQNPDGWTNAANTLNQLNQTYSQRPKEITRLMSMMESAWQGDASGQAQRGAGPLAVEHEVAAYQMNSASYAASSQASSLSSAKTSVKDPGPAPTDPHESGIENFFFGTEDKYKNALKGYNATNQHNVDVMNNYAEGT
ncbi:MAG: hypothetical protein J2O49_03745, partial [Sciscionella sp.]|nr:hypothetical protein [Sciscionella sp.]